MKRVSILFFFLLLVNVSAQVFTGQIYIKEDASLYLNQVYVTNITEQKTVISNYNGEFSINAKPKDILRFTSIITERKDIEVTEESLKKFNTIELKAGYHEIKEVIIGWKPSGNLRKDVLSLKGNEKKASIASMIGLPQPKGDGTSPIEPIAALQGGGLSFSIDAIYDILSGERKKKQRLYEYEKMIASISSVRNYFGDDYFIRLKVPVNLINNFLQFVYTSDNFSLFVENKKFESVKPYFDKYIPIYQKRLKDSNLTQIVVDKN